MMQRMTTEQYRAKMRGKAAQRAGEALEQRLTQTFDLYRKHGLADIEKHATPAVYSKKQGRLIYTRSASLDFSGVGPNGRAVIVEAKAEQPPQAFCQSGGNRLWYTAGGNPRLAINLRAQIAQRHKGKTPAGKPRQVARLDLAAELGALVLVCIYCEVPVPTSAPSGCALETLYAIRWGEWGMENKTAAGPSPPPITAEEFRAHQVPLRRGVWDVLNLLA